MAVLGPMTGEPATRAAQIAQEYRVPIILMSHWEGLPQLGSYVFRHSLTSRQQAEALANYAVRILGLETFALLQPENELGDNFSRLFRHAIVQMGAEVVYHRTYPQGSTDFRTALKPMMPPELEEESKDDVPAEEGGEIEDAKEALEPELEFEALFIPDFSETIALLAPQLAFSDIEDVQLLGINGWNSRKLLEQAGRYVRGAVFSDGFDPDSSDIFVQNFVTRYRQRYAEEPTILVAQAYDATNFLVRLLRDHQVEEPRNLRSLIPRTEYTGGVSGLRGFSADGEAMRDIVLFKIGRKKIERIDPAALQAPALEELSLPLGE
jgi:ABC-type branched-subunit amino acid transport system substrate-binding protein